MKKYYFLFFIFSFGSPVIGPMVFAQNPLVKMWDYRYGGTYPDELTAFQQTSDDGFILAGYSNSGANGDKSQPTYGSYDYWIVKLNKSGIKEWDADFGGSENDYLTCVCQTSDGGYLLGGYSVSDISGCKTQNNWDVSGLTSDYWVVKTDSLGVKLWDKGYGGMSQDHPTTIIETNDGGFMIGGFSSSVAGGDKTQSTFGTNDYWIIKADAFGNKLWDKDFGGLTSDNLRSLRQTSDHGYILGGLSNSGISGNKTQASFGAFDFWLVKTDSLGNFLWDKVFGGNFNDYLWSLDVTNDKGFIFAGISSSGISGNKTTSQWGGTDMDFWAVKTDSLGNNQWQRNLGGTDNEDEFGNLSVAGDGGFVFAGTSYSLASGDKSEDNLGTEQGWFVKTDSLGNTVVDKTIAINSHDENGYAIQTRDGCYAFAHFNFAPVGGLKSQAPQGVFDYWIVRFCDSTILPVSAVAFVNPICPGTCTGFFNLSLNATSFLWSFPGATPSFSTDINPSGICYNSPGTYDVTLIAMSAVSIDTLSLNNFVTVYPYPPPQGINQAGDTLFANPGAVSYQWYYNSSIIPGATNYFYVSVLNGDYSVVATDINGCEVEAVIYNVVDVPSAYAISDFEIYPNPVSENLVIQSDFKDAISRISIFNTIGERIMYSTLNANGNSTMNIDANSLAAGFYLLEIISDKGIFRTKFIKQ